MVSSVISGPDISELCTRIQQAVNKVAPRYSWLELANRSEPCPPGWHSALMAEDVDLATMFQALLGSSDESDFTWTYRLREPGRSPLKVVPRDRTAMYFDLPQETQYIRRNRRTGNMSLIHPSLHEDRSPQSNGTVPSNPTALHTPTNSYLNTTRLDDDNFSIRSGAEDRRSGLSSSSRRSGFWSRLSGSLRSS